MESYLLLPICVHVVVLSEALGLSLYCNTFVVSMSNCTVLESLESRQWCTWPSAYNLLHRLIATEFLQVTAWLTLHLIRWQLPTPSWSISHTIIIVSSGLPPGWDIIACHVKYQIKNFLPSTQFLQQRYCKSSNQNQRHFVLCMWCVSALEICRASSQIKPCMIVMQKYCWCLHLSCVCRRWMVATSAFTFATSETIVFGELLWCVWKACRRTCGCGTRIGSYQPLGWYRGSNEQQTPGNYLKVLHFRWGWIIRQCAWRDQSEDCNCNL